MDEGVFKEFVDSAAAKKYAVLYRPLVERICAEEYPKYKNSRQRIKAARSRLHVLYGAYAEENSHKRAEEWITAAEQESGLTDALLPKYESGLAVSLSQEVQRKSFAALTSAAEAIMPLHVSTRERLPYARALYSFIFSTAEPVKSVLDIGCGFNPFAIPLIDQAAFDNYYACDIDLRTAALLNRWFSLLGLPQNAFCADVITETPDREVDLALMLKLLPVLESQRKGRGYQLLRQLKAKRIVISYPLRSLGGRKKGMDTHYSQAFHTALQDSLSGFTIEREAEIGHEMIYIISSL